MLVKSSISMIVGRATEPLVAFRPAVAVDVQRPALVAFSRTLRAHTGEKERRSGERERETIAFSSIRILCEREGEF